MKHFYKIFILIYSKHSTQFKDHSNRISWNSYGNWTQLHSTFWPFKNTFRKYTWAEFRLTPLYSNGIIFKHFRFSNFQKENILDFHSKWFIFSIHHWNEWNSIIFEWKITETRVPFIVYHLKVTQNRFWMSFSLQNES